ncbi:MAG: glutamate--tRNA ligase [Candidatus Odinarchaeum yellowstonii]|uniref:Glutamate--tRNA ligase n=1 Tax=Odinarchaeota yellowstonii (strain LCB_4) TaxID=1841599 RepID=A0AAF0D2N2_ODILC|nr:MAG: glutamate--tRNA ligase [Candidatus Odinarchaeum yellowstonii]
MLDEQVTRKILVHALENALKFNGKANPKAVLGKILADSPHLKNEIENLMKSINEVVTQVNLMSVEKQREEFLKLTGGEISKIKRKEEKQLPPLPNVDKYSKVVMRLAPYPSGPLHIGNLRMVILNDEYVKRYKGVLYLVYDDTIGSEEKEILPEAYDYIKEGLDWLNVKVDKVFYKSDRIPIFYEWCTKLLSDGKAYVCTCNAEVWRQEYKLKKKDCPCRSQTVNENLDKWEKMLNGVYSEGEAAVRLKTSMSEPDPALRDHVIMRISDKHHPRVGCKYRVWPLLEFSWAVDDYLLNITHILRGKDLIKEDRVEEIIWSLIGVPKREFIHYGRIRFQGLSLSKSKSAKYVKEGKYKGWRDPRTWSIQSLQARGFKPEAIREAILDLGLSLADIEYSPEILYSFNRRIIDPLVNRLFFVENPVVLEITGLVGEELKGEPPNHPDFPERGRRSITLRVENNSTQVYISKSDAEKLTIGDRIRLKDLANIQITGKGVTHQAVYLSKTIEEARSQGIKKIIQWVPIHQNIRFEIIMPNGELTNGLAEYEASKLKVDDVIQFERFGFIRVDKIEIEDNTPRINAFYLHS